MELVAAKQTSGTGTGEIYVALYAVATSHLQYSHLSYRTYLRSDRVRLSSRTGVHSGGCATVHNLRRKVTRRFVAVFDSLSQAHCLQYKDGIFKIATLDKWIVFVSTVKLIDEMRKAPELSFPEASNTVCCNELRGVLLPHY